MKTLPDPFPCILFLALFSGSPVHAGENDTEVMTNDSRVNIRVIASLEAARGSLELIGIYNLLRVVPKTVSSLPTIIFTARPICSLSKKIRRNNEFKKKYKIAADVTTNIQYLQQRLMIDNVFTSRNLTIVRCFNDYNIRLI
ncbi:hypothetical protein PUN28_009576 [Cardiocondyla obscurior]|uniref:Uncharacterized protein n=1 Tax=Cardiocondyla obscurior TaxID=286306 RepID=A0AAW2FUA7_9HYME